jgi:hypothetical protein
VTNGPHLQLLSERTYVRSMDRAEIMTLRRSLAVLPPKSAGLVREVAMRLLAQLHEMDERPTDLREEGSPQIRKCGLH